VAVSKAVDQGVGFCAALENAALQVFRAACAAIFTQGFGDFAQKIADWTLRSANDNSEGPRAAGKCRSYAESLVTPQRDKRLVLRELFRGSR
jgi:hypothetical protein